MGMGMALLSPSRDTDLVDLYLAVCAFLIGFSAEVMIQTDKQQQ
jgi:hypothetical protein